MSTEGTKPALLYIMQCYFNRAGVEEHVRDLRQALRDQFEVYVTFPEPEKFVLLKPSDELLAFPGEQFSWPMALSSSTKMDHAFASILKIAQPKIIHVQHFFNWPMSILNRVVESGIPAVMSYHDYFHITPYFTMQGIRNPEDCFRPEVCQQIFRQDLSTYLKERIAQLTPVLQRFQHHFVPAPYLATVLQRIYPSIKFEVLEHGIKPFERLPKKHTAPPIKFGCVGSVLPQKGSEFMLRAFIAGKFPPQLAELHFYGGRFEYQAPGIFYHGLYDQPDLPRICSEIDVAIIPSLFAETYSLVLSEMWMGGLPVLAADIGALGDRIRACSWSKAFQPGNARSLVEGLAWFINNPEWQNWNIPKPRTIAAMAADWAKLYFTLF